MSLLRRLFGDRVPEGFTGTLEEDEHVLASADTLVATSRGLWLPTDDGHLRLPWHQISKVTWDGGTLSVIEAEETGAAGDAVLIADAPARKVKLARPGRLPEVVRERVDGSIVARHRQDLPGGGGAWFVQRKRPGGQVLQVRPDKTNSAEDTETIIAIAREAADSI